MNKIQRFESEIIKVEALTPTVKNFHLSAPKDFKFKAGQHISLGFIDGNKKISRPYSIASDPALNHIELCIKRVEGGLTTPLLFELKKGDKLKIIGPLGKFTLEDKKDGDLVFVSTGTGISPFRSMVYELINSNFLGQIHILSGYRNENEILFKEEFEELSIKYANIVNQVTISRPGELFKGKKGYVKDLLHEHLHKNTSKRFFLCGLTDMIEDVSKFLYLEGVPRERICIEKYD